MQLSSGYVIIGAYADKIRRTLFAQLRNQMKTGEIDAKEVARAAAELNRLLYELYVNMLDVDKGDVTRVRIEYDIVNGQIVWRYDTLQVEVFRRVSQEEVDEAVRKVVNRAGEITQAEISYDVEHAGKSDLGDEIFYLKLNDEFAGAVVVTPLNGEAVVRGAVTKPTAQIIDRTKISYSGVENLKQQLPALLRRARNVEVKDALKVINEIKALVGGEESTQA